MHIYILLELGNVISYRYGKTNGQIKRDMQLILLTRAVLDLIFFKSGRSRNRICTFVTVSQEKKLEH